MNKKAMHNLTYGLFVLTAKSGQKMNGCIINTVMQVTSEPNRIAIAVNKANYTHDIVKETGKFTVSVISEKADFELFRHFGFSTGRETDKFHDFEDYQLVENELAYITKGTNAYISAEVEKTEDLGSHTLFIAKVTEMEVLNEDPSVSYAYYLDHIKPQPQNTANKKTVWRCIICGYEYEGEELPADFICPLCKHPASDFEKVKGE